MQIDIKNALGKYKGDVFLYYGNISTSGYNLISSILENKSEKKDTVCLILITYGGDPDAAYRIARALNHYYQNVEILVPDVCKSAGTLLCIGAKKLIISDRGELGPLDIQLSKPDEMFESMSGLDIIQALNALEHQVLSSFRRYLVEIRGRNRLTTKMTADIAVKLVNDFIAPIAAKIDPMTLGSHQRAMQIAYAYGERLNEMSNSLQQDALTKLISNYPSHSFVIDRKESASLFNNVKKPDEETEQLDLWIRGLVKSTPMPDNVCVIDLETLKKEDTDESTTIDDEK